MMLEIAIETDVEWDSSGSWETLVRRAAKAAIGESDYPDLVTADRMVELSVRLTSNDEVQSLNAKWRGKDRPTNVLSFPLVDTDELHMTNVAGPELLLGDIVLAHGVCASEAADKGIAVEAHAAHLVVHGTLHLLGYDHHDDGQAGDMEAREVRALAGMGISNPYEVAA